MRLLSTTLRRTPLPVLLLSLLLPLALLNACGSSNAATAPIATRSATATATPEPGTFYFTTDYNVTPSWQTLSGRERRPSSSRRRLVIPACFGSHWRPSSLTATIWS